MSSLNCDVCIVGGGVVGCATAYFLAADPDFDGSVIVLEPDAAYASSATPRSVGSIRQQFSTPVNVAIAQFGMRFIRNIGQYLSIDGQTPDIGFHEGGYLFLTDEAGAGARRLEYATAVGCGADLAWLGPAELGERFPWLNTLGLEGGTLGLSGEGWFDPWALLQAFHARARSLGVEYRCEAAVDLRVDRDRVTGVTTDAGETILCDWVVNASGIRARDVAAMAGVELPVHPRKRHVFVFDCRASVPGLPLTVLPEGIYVRPEGEHFITGYSPPPEDDPDCDDFAVDYSRFEGLLWPLLAERIKPFEAIRMINAWVGHYDVHPLDHNAILGACPGVANLLVAAGFSGHGLQQAPAVGRGLSEQIIHGEWVSLDLSPLSFERVLSGTPLAEQKIV